MTQDQGRKTKNERRATATGWSLAVARWSLALGLALLLSGCMLISGGRASSDALPEGGNISSTFVGAEGLQEQTIDTGAAGAALSATVFVQAERGELQVELINPDGSVAFAVKGRPDEQVARSGSVLTDDRGRLRYRVIARGARNGGYQVLYQPTGQ